MTDISIFAVKDDLVEIIRQLAHRRQLRLCLNRKGKYELYDPDDLSYEFLDEAIRPQIYLYPASQNLPLPLISDNIRTKFMGWIHVTPGVQLESDGIRVLTKSMLQGEDRADVPFKSASWLRSLRKILLQTYSSGVYGENIKFGGGREYPNTLYSKAALELFKKGWVWKQSPNDYTRYSPLSLQNVTTVEAPQ